MNEFLKRILTGGGYQSKLDNTGKLALRLFFGLSLALNHGWPTFRGALTGASDFPDPLGIGPGISMLLTGTAEFVFVLFVVAGFMTRVSVLPVLVNFSVAFFIFHVSDPFGRKELAYLYLSAMTAIALLGPGKYSMDYWLLKKKNNSRNFDLST